MVILNAAPDPWDLAARRFERRGAAAYLYNPLGFVDRYVQFPRGHDGEPGGLTGYQREVIHSLVQERREAVRGPHGLGKTTTKALLVHWFALSREDAGIDWKIITTAGAWRQLEKYLWPEIHKWANHLDWAGLGRRAYVADRELLDLSIKLHHGQASAVASSHKELIEGAHADSILYLFDEAKAIGAEIFDAAEGAFSGAGPELGVLPEAFGLAQSTPGDTSGRFYEIHRRKPGLEDWKVRHVTLAETISAGRVSPTWAAQRAKQWGPDSAVYANRVLGEFHSNEEDTVIPLQWIEDAMERFAMWRDQGSPIQIGRCVHGVDVARGGRDLTVIAKRVGPIVYPLIELNVADTVKVAAHVRKQMNQTDLSVVDVIGVGAGVVDTLRQWKIPVHAFNAARKSTMRDRSGELKFKNQRAAMWWQLREMLDPAFGPTLALPPDDELLMELTAPKFKVDSFGVIQIESKDDLRERIGRSTDHADAVGQSLLTDTEFNQVESEQPQTQIYRDPDRAVTDLDADAFNWE